MGTFENIGSNTNKNTNTLTQQRRISFNINLFTFENIGSNTNKNTNTNTLTQQRRISLNIKLFTLENIGSNTNKKQTQIHSLSRDGSNSISNYSLWRILAQIQIKKTNTNTLTQQ